MKIINVTMERFQIDLKESFRISFSEETGSVNILVKIETDTGLYGLGEAAPYQPVTGETTQTAWEALEIYRKNLMGMDPLCIEQAHRMMDQCAPHAASAKAAVDMALYDIMGKKAETPVYKLLGGFQREVQSDITIGIDTPEKMARDAEKYAKQGFRILKVKVGIDVEHDIEALKQIRAAVGEKVSLRVDANQGYSEANALRAVKAFHPLGVLAIEQAFHANDLDASARLKKVSPVNVMLDESVHSPQDAAMACKKDAADVLNIKLMKCGGLYRGMQINAIAEANHVNCMVGCMMESRLGISAGLSLVAAQGNITEADCDSFILCAEPAIGLRGGFEQSGDLFTLLDKPGLGITL